MDAGSASWGRFPQLPGQILIGHLHVDTVWEFAPRSGLPRGNGRSYGDVCQNADGALLDTRRMDRLLAFDPVTGIVRAESGVLIAGLIERFLPMGWFPPVVPGTRWVTLGGAVANDVHGKNHPRAGTFGSHVLALALRRSDGHDRVLRPGDADGLFDATVGGLGLTGLITWVELQLQRVPGAWLEETRFRLPHLDAYFERVAELGPTADHLVAWVDCLATRATLGRGYLSLARPIDGPPASPPKALPGVPVVPPIGLVGRPSLRLFNTAMYAATPRRPRTARIDPYAFFFPLDRVAHWNRLYGPQGFVQYQCVIPKAVAPAGIRALLETIAQSGRGSMLAVLKEFGSAPSPGLLSFPLEGTTLALDFPHPDADLFRLFDRLDAIVAEAGGRLYPAKDARWPGARFRAAYPAWERVEALRDPAFSSSFWRRVCP